MVKRRGVTYFVFLVFFTLLVGCSKKSNDEETNGAENETDLDELTMFEDEVDESLQEEEDEVEAANADRISETDRIVLVNEIEAVTLDNIEKRRWTRLKQSGGLTNRIYYGGDMLIQSESSSRSPGTYKYDLNAKEAVWQDKFMDYSGSSRFQLDNGILFVVKSEEILGVNEKTGEVEFTYQMPEFSTSDEIYISSDYVLVAVDGDLVAFDRENQNLLWQIPYIKVRVVNNTEHKIPLVNQHFILSYENERIAAVDAETGKEKWSIDLPQMMGHSYAVNEASLYVFNDYTGTAGFNLNKTIAKYDFETLEKIQEVALGPGKGIAPGTYPILTEDRLIYRTIDVLSQSIVSVNHGLTEEQWVVQFDEYLIDHMIYDNGNLYVIADNYATGEFELVTIDTETGEVKEKLILEDGSNNNPNTFYTYDGKVYINIDEKTLDEFYYVIDQEDANRPLP